MREPRVRGRRGSDRERNRATVPKSRPFPRSTTKAAGPARAGQATSPYGEGLRRDVSVAVGRGHGDRRLAERNRILQPQKRALCGKIWRLPPRFGYTCWGDARADRCSAGRAHRRARAARAGARGGPPRGGRGPGGREVDGHARRRCVDRAGLRPGGRRHPLPVRGAARREPAGSTTTCRSSRARAARDRPHWLSPAAWGTGATPRRSTSSSATPSRSSAACASSSRTGAERAGAQHWPIPAEFEGITGAHGRARR